MEIIYPKLQTVNLSSLKKGDTFIYSNKLCLKVDLYEDRNVDESLEWYVCLEDNEVRRIPGTVQVVQKKSTVKVQ